MGNVDPASAVGDEGVWAGEKPELSEAFFPLRYSNYWVWVPPPSLSCTHTLSLAKTEIRWPHGCCFKRCCGECAFLRLVGEPAAATTDTLRTALEEKK